MLPMFYDIYIFILYVYTLFVNTKKKIKIKNK